jgi:protease IV
MTGRSRNGFRMAPRRGSAWPAGLLLLVSLLASGCVFVSGDLNPFSRRPRPLEEHVVSGEGDAKLLLIDIDGPITSEEKQGPLGIETRPSTIGRLEAELKLAGEDDAIKAILLRVNSPGGTVTASDIIYHRLMRFKAEHGVPVIAQFMDVAASGGYYASLAADEIVAHPTTITGSIGVIFTGVSVAGLLDKLGVRDQTIKTGAKKDIGSPLRAMTEDERRLLQNLLGEMQARFLGLVRERRPKVTDETAALIADGRVVSAGQALEMGLVDRIGYLDDTIELAKRRVGVEKARVILYRRPDEYAESVYSRSEAGPTQVNLINVDWDPLQRHPQFLYLWNP